MTFLKTAVAATALMTFGLGAQAATYDFAADADAFFDANGYEGTFDQVYGVGGDSDNTAPAGGDAALAGTLGGNTVDGVTVNALAFNVGLEAFVDPFMDSNVAGLGVCSGGTDYTGSAISDCSTGYGDATSDDNLVWPEVLALLFDRSVLLTELLVLDANHNATGGLIGIAWEGGIGLFEYVNGVVDLTGLGWSEVYLFSSNAICGKEAGIIEFGDKTSMGSFSDFDECDQNELYISSVSAAVPIPAAGFLLLGGLGGLAALRRRKKA